MKKLIFGVAIALSTAGMALACGGMTGAAAPTMQINDQQDDQDIDGVQAEVIYTTLGLALFQLTDAKLQQACFRVYNDWIPATWPGRLITPHGSIR